MRVSAIIPTFINSDACIIKLQFSDGEKYTIAIPYGIRGFDSEKHYDSIVGIITKQIDTLKEDVNIVTKTYIEKVRKELKLKLGSIIKEFEDENPEVLI